MANNIPAELLFSATFPLPFRVLSLAGFGILGWATNLHGLHLAGLDARSVLDFDHYDPRLGRRPVSPLPINGHAGTGWRYYQSAATIYKPIYILFAVYALWTLVDWLVFRYATFGDIYLVDAFKFIPAVAGLAVLTVLVSPFNVLAKSERDRFIHAFHRCLFPPHRRIYFADVVFADVFTSFAKVLGDMWLSFCMLMPGGSLLVQPAQEGWVRWILPTLMSLPYAVRFRQCLIEYRSPTNESRRPLYNALKYATSFPVIYLSAAQRVVSSELTGNTGHLTSPEALYGDHTLFWIWLLAAAINSLYSFWWDVTHDWGFDLLVPRSATYGSTPHRAHSAASPPRPLVLPRLHSRTMLLDRSASTNSPESSEEVVFDIENKPQSPKSIAQRVWHPFGLRPTLLFPLSVYPFAIVADLVLRLTWSAKLSSHLHSYADGDLLIFCFELAEVVRRWMWVFIRVEWEIVKQDSEVHARSPPKISQIANVGDESFEMIPSDHSAYPSPDG